MKRLFLIIFLCVFFIPTVSSGEDLYEEQLDRGIKNSTHYSYLLIKKSKEDPARAKEILKEALRYSPDLPAVYFELSKASLSFSPEGIFEAIDYIRQGIAAYKQNFWWSFTMIGSLFTSVILSFVVSIIIIVLIRLLRDVPLLSHDIKEIKTKALLLLILISTIIGPLFAIAGILIILSLYMKKRDKAVVYLYLLFLFISPLIFRTTSMFFNASASDELKAVVEVNESKGSTYALSLLSDRNDDIALFSYALALKREYRYDEAIDIYNKLIAKKPDPRVYNNLANCYAALNDMEKAKEFYTKAIELKPLPSTFYNLSQVSRETLDFVKGEEYFLSAQKLDRDAVSRFRVIFSRNPNRFVIDEGLPSPAFWEYSKGKTTSTSTMGLSTVSPALMSVIAFSLMILFHMLNKRIKQRAYRCTRCGTILCNKCEKRILWGHMCPQCFRSLIKLDELDAKERVARLLTVYEHQKKRRDIIKMLSFIIPGTAQIYAGSILYGLLFLWSFLFLLFIPLTTSIFIPEMSSFSHFWLGWSALFFMAIVYFISNAITRRRLARGWL
jgi:tetratricopeptide (TPR) repeat protein